MEMLGREKTWAWGYRDGELCSEHLSTRQGRCFPVHHHGQALITQVALDPDPGQGVPTVRLTSSQREGHTGSMCLEWPSSALASPLGPNGSTSAMCPPMPAPVTIPRTSRRALQRRVSVVKVTVPESSSASPSSVRLCLQPVALIRHLLLGFTRMPSRVQTPGTPG